MFPPSSTMAMATGWFGCCVACSSMAAMARWTWSRLSIGLLYIENLHWVGLSGWTEGTGMPGSVGIVYDGVKHLRRMEQGVSLLPAEHAPAGKTRRSMAWNVPA